MSQQELSKIKNKMWIYNKASEKALHVDIAIIMIGQSLGDFGIHSQIVNCS